MRYTLILEMNDGEIFNYDYNYITTAMSLYFRWKESTCCKCGQVYDNYKETTICSFGF